MPADYAAIATYLADPTSYHSGDVSRSMAATPSNSHHHEQKESVRARVAVHHTETSSGKRSWRGNQNGNRVSAREKFRVTRIGCRSTPNGTRHGQASAWSQQ